MFFNGNNPLKNIFNRKTIKISYSCTNNLSQVISNHIIKIYLKKSCVDRESLSKPLCNYRVWEKCLVGGKCNSENVVYKATIFPIENSTEKPSANADVKNSNDVNNNDNNNSRTVNGETNNRLNNTSDRNNNDSSYNY